MEKKSSSIPDIKIITGVERKVFSLRVILRQEKAGWFWVTMGAQCLSNYSQVGTHYVLYIVPNLILH